MKTQIAPATEKLKGHPGLADVFVLLCSGWPVSRVAKVITKRFGIITTADDVEEYLESIPQDCLFNATALTRPGYYESVVEELADGQPKTKMAPVQWQGRAHVSAADLIIDTKGEATQLLLLMRQRIQAMQMAEAAARPSRLLTDAIKVYSYLLYLYEDRYVVNATSSELTSEPVITLKDIICERSRKDALSGETERQLLPGRAGAVGAPESTD